jgi:hypothetical protein
MNRDRSFEALQIRRVGTAAIKWRMHVANNFPTTRLTATCHLTIQVYMQLLLVEKTSEAAVVLQHLKAKLTSVL